MTINHCLFGIYAIIYSSSHFINIPYVKPENKTLQLEIGNLLESFSGQHKPLNPGGVYGDAKSNNLDWEAWDDDSNSVKEEE